MTIIYLVFGGNKVRYLQSIFSILTLLSKKKHEDTIMVITDEPQTFRLLKKNIIVETLTTNTIEDWKGASAFFWRIKIKALIYAATRAPDKHILYLDADTVIFDHLREIANNLNKGYNIMHLNEGPLSKMKQKTNSKMWRQTKNKSYTGLTITVDKCMWNAGVVGIAKNHHAALKQALDICDEMCLQGVTRRLIEQFALSLALTKASRLAPAYYQIGHYWSNKNRWNETIIDFFCQCHIRQDSLKNQIAAASSFDFESMLIPIKPTSLRYKTERLLKNFLRVK